MGFEVDIIRALQMMSNGFLDAINHIFSFFGTEIFFMIVALVLYWCIDKKFAYRFFNVYILGVALTNVMKISFKRTRPFDAYPHEVRSIGDRETSYSFPSGHTETIASVSTLATIKYGKSYKIIPIIGVMLTALVMVSRMYLGQHYLSDVLVGLLAGILFAISFNFLLSLFKDKEEWFLVPGLALAVIIIAILAGVGALNTSEDMLKGLGAFMAFDIGYFVEKKWVGYDIHQNTKWWNYALRILIGGGVTVGIQYGFKPIFPESIPMLYCFLRYFLMALWAALAAPLIFKAAKI
ncbi:MAG: phosphatase PAP2 family protein [Clostridiales bacterium]|nr:phosphatase PAP2 family protein [Clostridiales bacterium]